jgi:cytochrome c-type biogenesis protein CcmH
MSTEMKLSKFPRVVVGARISRSGNATPQSGDLIGQSTPGASSAAGLRIVIDSVQP